MQSIVFFSGPSAINLVDVIPYGHFTEIGCNHFDDFRSVDHIVAYDRPMVQSIQPKPNCQYWTQGKWLRSGWHQVTHKNPHQGDSGQLAVALAQQLDSEKIYIIGCDWGVSDASIQQHHYAFRGWRPPKYTNIKDKWLSQLDQSNIVWVHLERQAWMLNYQHHNDFLRSCSHFLTSTDAV